MKKVLITDPITSSGLSILQDSGLDVLDYSKSPQEEWEKVLPDIHGWIIRSGTRPDEKLMALAPKLEVIGRAGVGVDNIDIPYATRHGIVVMNTPDVNTISAAEHTIGMILAVSRNISQGHLGLSQGQWNRHALIGTELKGKTLGVVGCGKIGREVMTRVQAFGMNILGYDPYFNQDHFNPDQVKMVDLDILTKESDFITLHVPLVEGTKNLFNLDRFQLMKSTSRIVNVARGGIINESDLAQALKDGIIAGAAIDVFENEPIGPAHPLVHLDNCVITPHLGASTEEAKEGVSGAVCRQVRDYLTTGSMANALNTPMSNMTKMKEILPFLNLAELLGNIQSQLGNESIDKVVLECHGDMDDIKPLSLAFLKGLLERRISGRLNYINIEARANDFGIDSEVIYQTGKTDFSNLIVTKVMSNGVVTRIDGSIFGDMKPRIVNIFGHEIDIIPKETMLLVKNKDIPGVIGKVGTLLSNHNINIGAYVLSDTGEDKAFGVIRVNTSISQTIIQELESLDEIEMVQQVVCRFPNEGL